VFLFEDETGFSLHPKLGRIWANRGSQPFVYTRSQHHKQLNIFGWVDLIQGSHGIMKWVSVNTDGFIQMLRKIVYRFKGRTIDLWVDNARWHIGTRVEAFVAEYSFFHIHYLPAYHPELNYQERIWHANEIRGNDKRLFRNDLRPQSCRFQKITALETKKIKDLCL
jgi:transposase